MIYFISLLAKLIASHNGLSKSVQYYRKLGCNEFCKVESCTYLAKKQASTGPCSVVKHTGGGGTRKKCKRKHETQTTVSPYFLSALLLPISALQQNRAQCRLL